jgi:hypothetical protein
VPVRQTEAPSSAGDAPSQANRRSSADTIKIVPPDGGDDRHAPQEQRVAASHAGARVAMRLRMPLALRNQSAGRNNRHVVCAAATR